MKNSILNTNFKKSHVDIVLLLTRIGVAFLMLTHGLPKLQMILAGGEIQFPAIFGLSSSLSLVLAIFSEVLCSLFILVGLATRLAAVPLIITMLVAVLLIHTNDPFANQELGLLYIFLYLPLLILGGGKFSVDHFLYSSRVPLKR